MMDRQLPACTRARRQVGLSVLGALLMVACAPGLAWADIAGSTPLHWVMTLPAVVVPSLRSVEASPPPMFDGRIMVALNFGQDLTPGRDLDSEFRVSPSVGLSPSRGGWGSSFGLNWFKADIRAPLDGQSVAVAQLRVRPLMAGISYSVLRHRLLTSLSLIGGFAFNRVKTLQGLPAGVSASLHIRNSWVAYPHVGLTYGITRRLALRGSVGYIFARPPLSLRVTQNGVLVHSNDASFRGDYFNCGFGIGYAVF